MDDCQDEDVLVEALKGDCIEPKARKQEALDHWLDLVCTRPCWPNVRVFAQRGQCRVNLRKELITEADAALVVPVGGFDKFNLRFRV